MNLLFQRVIAPAAFCSAAAISHAADPIQVEAPASLPAYRSAFADYKPLTAVAPGDWRSLNDAAKDDGMASMPGMDMDMGKGAHGGMPGMAKTPGQGMSMPPARASTGPTKARAPFATASMPAMKGMPGMRDMPGHAGHEMPGSKP